MNFGFEHPWFLFLLLLVPVALLVLRVTLVDSPRAQLALSAATRCTIIVLLVFALGSLLRVSRSDRVTLMVLGDVSDSVGETAPAQISNFWAQVSAKRTAGAKIGLATFAGSNQPLVAPGNPAVLDRPITRPVPAAETAVERALMFAWQTMPPDTVKREKHARIAKDCE